MESGYRSQRLEALRNDNARLAKDVKELRDLCCFLDDERKKARRMAKEWQHFARQTVKMMKEELENYRRRLSHLDGRHEELERDNSELKDLCLYLDEERNGRADPVCSRCSSRCVGPEQSPESGLINETWQSCSSSDDDGMEPIPQVKTARDRDVPAQMPDQHADGSADKVNEIMSVYRNLNQITDRLPEQCILRQLCLVAWRCLDTGQPLDQSCSM